uniref:ELMO domain-containing protein n=1 Tax=Musa acuminata subsp. malaccensis TaxID=214687 RepID=A0A804J8B4_MUSAM
MTTRTIRRRLHHGDVDGRKSEFVEPSRFDVQNEPLLGNDNHSDNYKGYDDRHRQDWDDKTKEVDLHWTCLLSNLTVQWSQWLASIARGSGSVLGRLLSLSSITSVQFVPICLTPLQEERLRNLRRRLKVRFDGSHLDHLVCIASGFANDGSVLQDALKQLWQSSYPNREVPPFKSDSWKEMGWQGCDPSTDFRGGGFISLENLIYFAKNYPNSFQMLLHKSEGRRAEWEYPFAVAGVNVSFMLIQMLDLQSDFPSSKAGVRFLGLLGNDEKAFDNLYCIAFCMLDAQWLARHASYMEFNEVLKFTRIQLERELALEDVTSIKDLPAYNMII